MPATRKRNQNSNLDVRAPGRRRVRAGLWLHRRRPSWVRRTVLAVAVCVATSLGAGPSAAEQDLSQVCERAAVEAAAASGVPVSVLKAISLTETGRERGGRTRPWPWTVNMEGTGVWFDSREAALSYVYEHYKRGARSFDVGCFQINYKWHHQHFASIEAMFDPSANAGYAAEFLLSLHGEKGDWAAAAGAYHSRTPEYANRYKTKFAEYRARFLHEDELPLIVEPPILPVASAQKPGVGKVTRARVNTFPLLRGGGQPALGSLVPLADRGAATGLFARGGKG